MDIYYYQFWVALFQLFFSLVFSPAFFFLENPDLNVDQWVRAHVWRCCGACRGREGGQGVVPVMGPTVNARAPSTYSVM